MRAHLVLGFNATLPISCISELKGLEKVIVYLPKLNELNPKSLGALRGLEKYLKERGISLETVYLEPCDPKSIFEVILKISDGDAFCYGSGMRSLGLMVLVACIVSSRRCKVKAFNDALRECMELELPLIQVKKEEAVALALAFSKGSVSPKDLEAYGIEKRTSWKVLNELVSRGFMKKVGRGKYEPLSVPWGPRT